MVTTGCALPRLSLGRTHPAAFLSEGQPFIAHSLAELSAPGFAHSRAETGAP